MKKFICLLLCVCLLLCLAACHENTEQPQESESNTTTESQASTEGAENKQDEDVDKIKLLTLEKTLHTYYEWADDYDRALVRSEHSCVMLGQSDADAYPEMAQVLSQIATMQENAMLDEFDNLVSFAQEELAASARPIRDILIYNDLIGFDAITATNGAVISLHQKLLEIGISCESGEKILSAILRYPDVFLSIETSKGLYSNRDIPVWEPVIWDKFPILPEDIILYKILASSQQKPLYEGIETTLTDDVYHTIANNELKIPFISIRSITDTATHSGTGHFEENCQKASSIAKNITVALLAELRAAE